MTNAQRVKLMSKWWPDACRAKGWNQSDRALRIKVLGEAVNRPLKSANELNSREDIDRVVAHLGFLADNVAKTIETEHPEIGSARRKREAIRTQLKCLAVYEGCDGAEALLARLVADKFAGASLKLAPTLEDLTDETTIRVGRRGDDLYEWPSKLDQILMRVSQIVNDKRNENGDSIHDMKMKAEVYCDCSGCSRNRRLRATTSVVKPLEKSAAPVPKENQPF